MTNVTTGNPILFHDLDPLGNINDLILQRFPDAFLFKRRKQCKPECSGSNTKEIKVSTIAYQIRKTQQGHSSNQTKEKEFKNTSETICSEKLTNAFDHQIRGKEKRKTLSERISDVLRKPRKEQR